MNYEKYLLLKIIAAERISANEKIVVFLRTLSCNICGIGIFYIILINSVQNNFKISGSLICEVKIITLVVQ